MKARFSQLLKAASVLAVASTPGLVSADQSIFLKIEGVTGGSLDKIHKGEIEVQSFSLGVSNSTNPVFPEQGGKANFTDLATAAILSQASPVLSHFCATGKQIPTAKLVVRSSGLTPVEFYTVELSNVRVSSVSTSGASADGAPMESYTLSFSSITWTFVPVSQDGKAQQAIITSFNLATQNP